MPIAPNQADFYSRYRGEIDYKNQGDNGAAVGHRPLSCKVNEMAELLFVYGTLRQGAEHPMHTLLAEHASLIGKARLQGRLYAVDGYPALVLSDSQDEQVEGELYRLHGPGILTALDDYEECSDRFTEPREYRRARIPVTLDDGYTVSAWAYLYNRSLAGLERIDCGDYLAWAGRRIP
jgi:gamma-glutamylcyclotransferase (GGCT)/AIG2-like uncharacterized protein YtfP